VSIIIFFFEVMLINIIFIDFFISTDFQ
jgi:hypothetical protein